MTLRELFVNHIMFEDDDFYIVQDFKIVSDNRKCVDCNLHNYIDIPIKRLRIDNNHKALKITLTDSK